MSAAIMEIHEKATNQELNFEKFEIKTIQCICLEVIETELQI